jgi:mRNA interferase YafQ
LRTNSRSSKFKKDLKRQAKRGRNLDKLKRLMILLIDGVELPATYLDHPLRGEYAGCRDCHVEPDWLLIYMFEDDGAHVTFLRTGTHSDLFG